MIVKKRLQRGANAPSHSLWLRGLALACLLMIGVVSTAQAAHVHGQLLPHKSAHLERVVNSSELPGGEEKCPLCVAMHSGFLPVTLKIAPIVTTTVLVKAVSVTDRLPDSVWHFAQFSRPPPAMNS